MLIEALRWWSARMGELVPDWLMQRRTATADAVIVLPGATPDAPATLLLRRNRRETPLGDFIPDSTPRERLRAMLGGRAARQEIRLRPPPASLLEKPVVLPSAAEPELRHVLGYEMNRLTPFALDDVFWTWQVVTHDRANRRLHIRLSLVLQAPLRPLIAALTQAGLAPALLEVATGVGPPIMIPVRQASGRTGWQRRAVGGLAIACGVLAVVAAGLPFVLQSLALGEQAERIAAVQPQVTEVQALRARIAAQSAGMDAIADARLKSGDALGVLAAVTQLLPDDTYLVDLALRERRLTITGQSASAPKLIGGLAADPTFRNPGFAAPVTRNAAADRDVFSIRTEVGP